MGGVLSNCARCGKLFVKFNNDICPNCIQEIENEYLLCSEYLKENRNITIYQLSEATDVSVKQITKFIKEGRISISDHPNIVYPCEICGTSIREGRYCKKCAERLNKDIKKVLGENATDEKEEERQTQSTYYQFNNRFKK